MIPTNILAKYEMATIDRYLSEIDFYKTFLQQTDHIPNKIIEKLIEDLAEATLLNILEVLLHFITAVKVEYKEILRYRKQAREKINELEAAEVQPAAE